MLVCIQALARLSKNEGVGVATLDKIRGVLKCKMSDVLEYVPDSNNPLQGVAS